MLRHRAYTPFYLVRYWRFFTWKAKNPHIITEGFVFLGKNVELYARKGYGRLILGKWVHIGNGNALRAHEGTLRIGDKCVFGKDNTVNTYLDIEFGSATIVADWVYVCDFDHVFTNIHLPIKDQGITKSPVRIGPDCWLGTKVTVLRGTTDRPRLRRRRALPGQRRRPRLLGRRGVPVPRRAQPGGRRPGPRPAGGRLGRQARQKALRAADRSDRFRGTRSRAHPRPHPRSRRRTGPRPRSPSPTPGWRGSPPRSTRRNSPICR